MALLLSPRSPVRPHPGLAQVATPAPMLGTPPPVTAVEGSGVPGLGPRGSCRAPSVRAKLEEGADSRAARRSDSGRRRSGRVSYHAVESDCVLHTGF